MIDLIELDLKFFAKFRSSVRSLLERSNILPFLSV